MTEEQKKKCEEIYNLLIDSYLKVIPGCSFYYSNKYEWIKITMLLAEVFNKKITEEKAEEISNNIYSNIYRMTEISMRAVPVEPLVAPNTIFWEIVDYFGKGHWEIANYFDKHFDNDNNKENENNK